VPEQPFVPGSSVFVSGVQVPTELVASQRSHGSHAVPQQTPSTQWPLAQSVPELQGPRPVWSLQSPLASQMLVELEQWSGSGPFVTALQLPLVFAQLSQAWLHAPSQQRPSTQYVDPQ
jgi:hypothetical protein